MEPSTRTRRFARLVLSGALAAAALALPACGGDDPGATSGVGGVIDKAKATASDAESRDATLDTGATTTP